MYSKAIIIVIKTQLSTWRKQTNEMNKCSQLYFTQHKNYYLTTQL